MSCVDVLSIAVRRAVQGPLGTVPQLASRWTAVGCHPAMLPLHRPGSPGASGQALLRSYV